MDAERRFPPEPINHRTRSDCRAALPEHQQRSVLGSSNKRNNKFFIILWELFSRCWAEVKNLSPPPVWEDFLQQHVSEELITASLFSY